MIKTLSPKDKKLVEDATKTAETKEAETKEAQVTKVTTLSVD
jgi:hypothetical protein